MSVINKVLEDLDKREAMAGASGRLPPQQVRPVHGPAGREWFWRAVALLIVVALAWVGWVAWQLRPRSPVVTEAAFRAGESARNKTRVASAPKAPTGTAAGQVPPPAPSPATSAAAVVATRQSDPGGPAADNRNAVAQIDSLKLALAIETPITARPEPQPKPKPEGSAKPRPDAGQAKNSQASPRLEKRDSASAPAARAEGDYRRAVAFLNQGRLSEAQNRFAAALEADPEHEPARQAWAALLVEQGRFEEAKKLLVDGLARQPANGQFAVVLARIVAGQGDYAGALEVLEKLPEPARKGAEYHALRGALLQKLKRHLEATQAYQAVIREEPENGTAWLGLGISLEALMRRAEAAEAFKRAAASGMLNGEVKRYAEQRAQALQ